MVLIPKKKKNTETKNLVQKEFSEAETIISPPKIKKQKTENIEQNQLNSAQGNKSLHLDKEEMRSSSQTVPKTVTKDFETPVSIQSPPIFNKKINFPKDHSCCCCTNHITNCQLRCNTAFYFGLNFPNSTDVRTNFDIEKTKTFLKKKKMTI